MQDVVSEFKKDTKLLLPGIMNKLGVKGGTQSHAAKDGQKPNFANKDEVSSKDTKKEEKKPE